MSGCNYLSKQVRTGLSKLKYDLDDLINADSSYREIIMD